MTFRVAFKGAAERALIWSGVAGLHRRRMSGRVLVLAYHNIVPDGMPPGGDRANHLPLSMFVEQLSLLRETHDVVPLADTMAPSPDKAGRPRAAITFDDAYRGAVRYGVAELVRQGLPATIFVAPACLGQRTFWWDALATTDSGLSAEVRTRALDELRGEHSAVMEWARGTNAPVAEMAGDMRSATEEELIEAASHPGITLGSHTWSHPNLTRLSTDEMAAELAKPLAWLRDRVRNPLPWLAYPYGAFDDAVTRGCGLAGYAAGLAISGGWFARAPRYPFALPRVNIPPGVSRRGFAIRAAGLLCD